MRTGRHPSQQKESLRKRLPALYYNPLFPIKETDKLLSGNSVRITTPKMTGRFKRTLNAQIIKYGSHILHGLRALEIVSGLMNKTAETHDVAWNKVFQRISNDLADMTRIAN